jgi:MFS transporter, FHS family, L-fucose permease
MNNNDAPGRTATAIVPIILITSLFFMWGVANNLNDILITQFKKAFVLSDFQAGLVQSAFYLGYFFFAIPAGLFMQRFGYKAAVIMGLAGYAAGAFLFWPAAAAQSYGFFLAALFIIASGLAFLETSANPLITVLGPAEGAERRLNLAQAFNPLGSIAGVVIGQWFILSGVEHDPATLAALEPVARQAYLGAEAQAVQMPYLVIGLIVTAWAVLIAVTRFPAVTEAPSSGHDSSGTLRIALANPMLRFAVIAQFFYVGAQVGIWSYLIRYAQGTIENIPERTAANYLTAALVTFMIGRFVGAALMRYIPAPRVLSAFAAINVLLCAVAIAIPGLPGLVALVVASFFMSVMFPTIFAVGIRELDSARKMGSSLIVMAIIGGAVLTAAMGAVSDAWGIAIAYVVPAACFAVILIFGLKASAARVSA